MDIVTIHKAKTNLSQLIARVEAGEEIVLARGDTPVAKLTRYTAPETKPKRKREPGALRGILSVGPEFFEPLSDEELRAWGEID